MQPSFLAYWKINLLGRVELNDEVPPQLLTALMDC